MFYGSCFGFVLADYDGTLSATAVQRKKKRPNPTMMLSTIAGITDINY